MKSKIVIALIIIMGTANLFSQQDYPLITVPQTSGNIIPAGWLFGGSNPHDYLVGVDLKESYKGYSSAYLQSRSAKPVGFVTLMQSIKAGSYKNQRVKLTGYLKTRFISGWSSLWMRVNDSAGKPLAFDDMRERLLVGSSEWKKVEIVLDIPPMSDEISFGFLLHGKGQVWVDNLSLTVVEKDIPVTDVLLSKKENINPVNLDFEE
jgi:hypothetical protein